METGGKGTFKLVLEYDGTGFAGWQVQPGRRTVQGEMEKALGGLAGEAVRVTAAGRTDAGVHATGQVVSFTMNWRHGARKLAAALNTVFPGDLAVVGAAEAAAGFDARRWAHSRKYRYTFLLRAVRSPLEERRAWRLDPGLDVAAMRRACALFRGRHNFTVFTTKAAAAGGAIRRITGSTLSREGERLHLEVTGEAFLHHMVRFMAAALAAVGQGRATVADIRRALAGKGSAPAAPAPARGLALVCVEYGPGRPRRDAAITRPRVSY